MLTYRPYSRDEVKGVVIICPGGGYEFLSPREARPVAEAFYRLGYQAAVLSYEVGLPVLGPVPLLQAAWSVAWAREQYPGKPVLLCGFSAGGHLAASLGVHWKDEALFPDAAYRSMIRPDGLILGYPVITAGEYRHEGSIRRLAGDGDSGYYSLEQFVAEDTPPTFLWHTAEDKTVSPKNSLLFAEQLMRCGVPLQLLVYPYGVHGLSLATREVEEPEKNRLEDPLVAGWMQQCAEWIEYMFIVGKGRKSNGIMA